MTEDLIWRFFINQPRQVSSKVCRRGRAATLFSSARRLGIITRRRTSNIKRCAMLMKELFRGRSSVASVAQGGLGPAPRAARPPSALHLAKRAVAHDILYNLGDTPVITRLRARWCLCGAARARWCPSGAAPAPQKPCHSVAGPLARRFGTPELCARSVEFARARSRSRSRSNTSTSLTI